MPQDHPLDVRVCVLGAGPHGLAMALHLVRADPTIVDDMCVLDPSGRWMSTWDEQFARLEIDVLRSPSVHHPDPDVDALAAFVSREGFMSSGLPYDLPMANAFRAFARHAADASGIASPSPTRPRTVTAEPNGRLVLEGPAEPIVTDRLVIACNPHRRCTPGWAGPLCGEPQAELSHAADVDLRRFDDLSGERIVVIGGGLTAAHLALGAARRGATIDLVARRRIETRPFDTDPGWLGPKYLRGFERCADPNGRLARSRAARGGGTIPAWIERQLRAAPITLHESKTVLDADVSEGDILLTLSDGERLIAQRVWLATGTTPDLTALRCLDPILPDIVTVDGLPVPGSDLRISRHPVHVMGRLATLELGPAAGNLWGARHAARRITRAVTGLDVGASRKR